MMPAKQGLNQNKINLDQFCGAGAGEVEIFVEARAG